MRVVVNFSLPAPLNSIVEKAIAKGRYATKSKFFRNLIRLCMEGKLAEDLKESRKELKAGKGKNY